LLILCSIREQIRLITLRRLRHFRTVIDAEFTRLRAIPALLVGSTLENANDIGQIEEAEVMGDTYVRRS
jgi:hypothetical protein